MSHLLVFIAIAFAAGYLAKGALAEVSNFYQAMPFSDSAEKTGNSPSDHVSEDQIHVFSDRIVLDIKNAAWSSFTPTGSMIPMFDQGANGIELTPKSADEIKAGDVISYRSQYADGIIIHRVTETGSDEQGWYAKVKGDNNPLTDPGKIRFGQIEGVLVGIIY